MDIRSGDILQMKKKHPCGCDTFNVIRVGMDFKLVCTSCRHEIMIARSKAEKAIKRIIREEEDIV